MQKKLLILGTLLLSIFIFKIALAGNNWYYVASKSECTGSCVWTETDGKEDDSGKKDSTLPGWPDGGIGYYQTDESDDSVATKSITSAYKACLGRDPEPEGLAAHKQAIEDNGGTNIVSVMRGICNSDEAKNKDEAGADDQSTSNQFLWKPVSDSDGKLVVLLPNSMKGEVASAAVHQNGKVLDVGNFSGDEHNGNRPHFRFPKPGADYGTNLKLVAAGTTGTCSWDIPNGAERVEEGEGECGNENTIGGEGVGGPGGFIYDPNGSGLPEEGSEDAGDPGTGDANFCSAPTNLRILAMGDSNTSGTGNPVGAATANTIGYRKALKDNLTASGYKVDFVGSRCSGSSLMSDCQHEGYPGMGIAKLQERVSAGIIKTYKPDVVLILVGSNDMWVAVEPESSRTPISDSAAKTKITALENLITKIHTDAPSAKIIVAKPATPNSATRPLNIYRNGIDQIATRKTYVGVVDFSGFSNNGVHYTPSGFGQIATAFANKIKQSKELCSTTPGTVPSATSTTSIVVKTPNGGEEINLTSTNNFTVTWDQITPSTGSSTADQLVIPVGIWLVDSQNVKTLLGTSTSTRETFTTQINKSVISAGKLYKARVGDNRTTTIAATSTLTDISDDYFIFKFANTANATSTASKDDLVVSCYVSDGSIEVGEEITIEAEIDGGKSPYKVKWSGDTSKVKKMNKTKASEQDIEFKKAGTYVLEVKVTDDEGNSVEEICRKVYVYNEGADQSSLSYFNTNTNSVNNNTNSNQNSNNTNSNSSFYFYRDLSVGSTGTDVSALQTYLIERGFLVIPSGVAKGTFGNLTKNAVIAWQIANQITPASGYFGAKSRAKISGYTLTVVEEQQTNVTQTVTRPAVSAASCLNINRTINYEETSADVAKIQTFLESKKYLTMPPGVEKGTYGRLTAVAITKYMAAKNISVSGVIIDSTVLTQIGKDTGCAN